MTPSAVAKLVEKWRKRAYELDLEIGTHGDDVNLCASELEAALATAPPEQAAVQRVGASRCVNTEADAKDGTDNSSCREQGVTGSMPQAASGPLSKEDLLALDGLEKTHPNLWRHFRECGQAVLELQQRLAAHDQKVRAEVLEEAVQAITNAADETRAIAAIKSLAGVEKK